MTNTDNEECIGDKKFENPQEELKFLRKKLGETQLEFQEFQESSRDLEAEYETQIEQLEKKNADSLSQINHLEDEVDQLRTKYNIYTNDTQQRLNEYQQQIAELTTLNERLTSYIRELEQNNDDLERAQRTLAASLEDFEGKLNQQIERNVLLENEISEKEELECIVQRLKEETRDLKHELIVNSASHESNRRKQVVTDGSVIVTQSNTSNISANSDSIDAIDSKLAEININANQPLKQASQQTPESSSLENGSGITRSSTVDSTTSPMTPSRDAKFTFSSPFSYNRIPSSRSTDSKSQQTSTPSSPKLPSIVMSPSSRLSSINITTEILKKVRALQAKLPSEKKITS